MSKYSALALGLVLGASVGACSSTSPDASSVIQELTSGGVNVTVSLQSDWTAGYCANVTLQNTGTAAVTSWTVVLDLNQATLANLWSGSYTQSGARLTVTPAGFNASIAPGTSTSFGFCGNATGSNYHPTLVSVSVVGGSGSGGGAGAGGMAAGGSAGAAGSAGKAGTGGGGATAGTGGSAGTSTGGTAAMGGGTSSGGTSSGGTSSGGSAGAGGSATCDPGTTTTTWATNCATAPATTCVAGTWTDPGSTTGDPVQCQSAHFVVHSPAGTITAAQCSDATNTLETLVWPTMFGSPMFFPEPYCSSSAKFKASIVIHSDYGLTGGGWGNGYMGMWVGPGATADHWGLAHEFTHAVQSQTKGLSCNQSNTCGWIYESHANWRSQQLPEYHTSNVHCSEMLPNAPHLYLGSTRDRYCNWQFMEYLKDKFCYKAVNDIWTAPTPSNDPFTNIAATRGWSTSQLNDFFGEWATHNVTWDYQDPAPETTAGGNQGTLFRSSAGYGPISDTSRPERRLRTVKLEALDAANRRYVVPSLEAPQRWGYNIVRLYPDAGATSVTVTFRGVVQSAASSDWRWALVATDSAITKPRYSKLQRGSDGQLSFCVNAGEALFLVVTATPSAQKQIVWDQLYPSVYRYPYMIGLSNAQPDGFQAGAPNPSSSGARWANGGGWVASGASVASGAYVGPYAAVLGGTVGATARIEDHATILSGSVSSGTVGGLTIMTSNLSVSGSARVSVAWPYAPGFFEHPQQASGTAQLLGDIEYRGANLNETSGSYCGFVDSTVSSNCTAADVTVPSPYVWRP